MCAQFGVVPAKTAASFAGTLLFPEAATSRPRELDAARRNTRVDNIFRVYSRQFSRGGVALIAVVHRGFASSLSLSRRAFVLLSDASCTARRSPRSNLRAAGATRTNARCARREGIRRIFVSAHSRANAHPSSRDPSSVLPS